MAGKWENDFDIDLNVDLSFGSEKENGPVHPKICAECKKNVAKTLTRKTKNIYRRSFSELNLLETLDTDMEDGYSYHVISGGDIDSLSFLKHIIRLQHSLEYCLFSTWCMALDDVLQIKEWIDSGKIKKMDAYVGEIFPGSYAKEYAALKKVIRPDIGRICVFRNHAKIYAGYGKKFYFAVESSANINTNPRTENTTVTIGKDIFEFYKDFFDGIVRFK